MTEARLLWRTIWLGPMLPSATHQAGESTAVRLRAKRATHVSVQARLACHPLALIIYGPLLLALVEGRPGEE